MKRLIKIPAVAFLIMAVLTLSAYCCCFVKSAAAEAQTVSCHQTAPEHQQPHQSDECQCPEVISMALEKADYGFYTASSDMLPLPIADNDSGRNFFAKSQEILLAFQEPPPTAESLPLYLKHSNLRL